jgi:hypothetical protein
VGFSKEDWFQERIRDRAERQEGFAAWRLKYPIQARLWLGFCTYADLAFEAMFTRGDVQELSRCTSVMAELATWIASPDPGTQADRERWFKVLLDAGLPIGQALQQATAPEKRAKGRPVSKRRLATLALEAKELAPDLSWMQLAMKFCDCSKRPHDEKCRDRLRQEIRILQKTLEEWGV